MLEFSKASQEYAACIQRKPADVMGAGSSFCLCVQAYIDGLGDLAPHCATAQKTMEETQASTRDICAPPSVESKRRLDGHDMQGDPSQSFGTTGTGGSMKSDYGSHNTGAAGSTQHDMTGGATNDGSMKSDHGSHNTGAGGSMQHDMTGGALNNGSMKSDHGSHNTGAGGSMQHDAAGGATS